MGSMLSTLLPPGADWQLQAVPSRWQLYKLLPVAAASYLLYSFLIKPFLSPLRKMPGLGYHPLLGNIREAMQGEAMEASTRWVSRYGGVLRFYGMFGRESVLVADPAAMRRILVTHKHKYGRPLPRTVPLGRSVLTVTGEEHKILRRLLNPVFSPAVIKGYVTIFEEFACKLVKHWDEKLSRGEGRLHVQADLFRMTFDVFGQAVLGYEFNSLHHPHDETVLAFKHLLAVDSLSYQALIPFYRYLPTARNRARWRSQEVVTATINKLINEKQTDIKQGTGSMSGRHDLLTSLLMARDEETGCGLTHQQIYDNLFTLIFAGYETTAMTLSWILLTLAQNQGVQVKARTEVNKVIGQSMTWDDLDKLDYMNSVIKEAQRLYPAAASVPRYTLQDDELAGYTVPSGTPIICHFGALMRNASLWENPDQFIPDRHLHSGAPTQLFSYLPFGAGATKCLGHVLARTQMRVVLATLLRHFTFSEVPGLTVRRKHKVTLKAVPDIELIVDYTKA